MNNTKIKNLLLLNKETIDDITNLGDAHIIGGLLRVPSGHDTCYIPCANPINRPVEAEGSVPPICQNG